MLYRALARYLLPASLALMLAGLEPHRRPRRDRQAPTAAYFVTHGPQGHEFSYLRAGSAASRGNSSRKEFTDRPSVGPSWDVKPSLRPFSWLLRSMASER